MPQLGSLSLYIALSFAILTGLGFWLTRRWMRRQVFRKGQYLETPMGPIFYQFIGNKGPVRVFIHGLGASSFCWRNVAPEFTEKGRVLVYDLWGFGQSSKNLSNPLSLDLQAAIFIQLLDSLEIKKVDLVGHSMGGALSIWITLCYPERIRRLALISPAAEPKLVSNHLARLSWVSNWTSWFITEALVARALNYLIRSPQKLTADVIRSYYQPYFDRQSHKCFAQALNMIRDPRVKERLGEIQVPTLLLWGKYDRVVHLGVLKSIQGQLTHATTHIHPWAGHLLMEDDVDWVNKQLSDFLK